MTACNVMVSNAECKEFHYLSSDQCSCYPMQLGTTAIGVRSKEGVVLVVEKRVTSPLLVNPLFIDH